MLNDCAGVGDSCTWFYVTGFPITFPWLATRWAILARRCCCFSLAAIHRLIAGVAIGIKRVLPGLLQKVGAFVGALCRRTFNRGFCPGRVGCLGPCRVRLLSLCRHTGINLESIDSPLLQHKCDIPLRVVQRFDCFEALRNLGLARCPESFHHFFFGCSRRNADQYRTGTCVSCRSARKAGDTDNALGVG